MDVTILDVISRFTVLKEDEKQILELIEILSRVQKEEEEAE